MTPFTPLPAGRSLDQELAEVRAEQKRLFADLAANQHHFRKLARSVLSVQEQERRRLARDLHDGVGQNLTALQHELEVLSQALGQNPDVGAACTRAQELCRTMLHDTRQLSRLLRPQILDDLGLPAALRWLMRTLSQPGGFEPELHIDAQLPALGDELDTTLFRVAQEALNNTVKHARARHVVLRLTARDGQVRLLLIDDGIGCDPIQALARASKGETTGLSAMAERVELLGGRLRLLSSPGEGTQILVSLQLDAGEASP